MNLLIIGNINSPLLNEYVSKIKQSDSTINIDILSYKKSQADSQKIYRKVIDFNLYGKKYNKIPLLYTAYTIKLLRTKLKLLSNDYDVCHIHSVMYVYSFIVKDLKKRSKKLITTYWGSDFYRSKMYKKWLHKNLIKSSDILTSSNNDLLIKAKHFFSLKDQQIIVSRFGLTALEKIKENFSNSVTNMENDLNIPTNSFIITCGSNANIGQQHDKIIDSIEAIKSKLPENYILIFPMTYGGTNEYIQSLKQRLVSSGLKHIIIQSFLSVKSLAFLRLLTKVMIQVQLTDQLSGAMQEHIFAKNYIITGSWLPYKIFDENKIVYKKVNTITEVGNSILEYIRKEPHFSETLPNNTKIIWKLSSWETTINQWLKLYS